MDHQSINQHMNEAIIFNQDMAWMRWTRQQIFNALDHGAPVPLGRSLWLDEIVADCWLTVWPHDYAADLIAAWQLETTS